MKNIYKKIMILLSVLLISTVLISCTKNEDGRIEFNVPNNTNNWGVIEESDTNDGFIFNNPKKDSEESSGIGIGINEEDIIGEIQLGAIKDIESLIYSAVALNLETVGFKVSTGVASTLENDNYSGFGLYYYNDSYEFFDGNEVNAVGFVEITNNKDVFYKPSQESSMIVVTDSEEGFDENFVNVVTYNYNEISSYHFIYQGKYVTYYQQDDMRIVYDVLENNHSSYNLEFGSLYDYDKKLFVYDETIFGEYKNHNATGLIDDVDYEKLGEQLKTEQENQLKNGYILEEYKIVYISPESIELYLSSEESSTFFGMDVNELTNSIGLGQALEYTSQGFITSQIMESTENNYDWKSFLTKIGIGTGIIIVGSALTPLTGGASFTCSLVFITKFAVGFGLTSAIVPMVIEATKSVISGDHIVETLSKTTFKGLDNFANGFIIGAAIASVGTVSKIIKPNTCFVPGTMILVDENEFGKFSKPIEEIRVGDYVMSYNEITKEFSKQQVTELFVSEVDKTIELSFGNTTIESTLNHPYYSISRQGWVEASDLFIGELVLDSNNKTQNITEKKIKRYENLAKVYNFTVDVNHTYFVGENSILVHNTCTTLQSQRNKGVSEAWKLERKAVDAGTSKYNWTPEQLAEITKYGKVKGYNVNGAHIVDVNVLKNTVNAPLVSDPNNIVFLTRSEHLAVHGGSWKNPTNPKLIVELLPWASKQVQSILGMIV